MPGRSQARTGSRPTSVWPAAGSCRSVPRCRARPARSRTSSSSRRRNEPRHRPRRGRCDFAAAGAAFLRERSRGQRRSSYRLATAAEAAQRSIIRTRMGSRFTRLTPKKTPDGRDWRAVPAAPTGLTIPRIRRPLSPRRRPSARSNTTATPWGCRTPRRCRRRIRWGWTTSPSTKARTTTMARSSSRPARFSAPARNPSRSCGTPSGRHPRAGHRPGGRAPRLGRRAALRGVRRERRQCHDRRSRSQGAAADERLQPGAFQRRRRISCPPSMQARPERIERRADGDWRTSIRRSRRSRSSNAAARSRSRFPGSRRRTAIVVERNAVNGMRAQPGDVLFRIADHSPRLGGHRRRRARSRRRSPSERR